MPRVFVDTLHYIALLVPSDDLHDDAISAERDLAGASFVTTDAVLVELLAYVAKRGSRARREAVGFVDDLKSDPRTLLVRQEAKLFDAGLDLYRRRGDKGYSLTDCMSMVVCRDMGIEDVLTHDQHFAQEGFRVLL